MTDQSPSPSSPLPVRWLKTFWQALIGSISDLNYYVAVLNTSFKFSLKFSALFYLLLGIVLTIIFTIKEIPELSQNIDSTRAELVEKYPPDLSFSWNGSELSSSSLQPIQVPFPSSTKPVESAPKYLAEINTNTDQAPENTSALLYLNKHKLYVNSLQGNWSESTIEELIGKDAQQVNRDGILKLAENSKPMQADFLLILPWLALPFFTIGMFLLRLFMIAFNTIIVQFLFQITNKPLSYKKVYQLSLHALVPVELLHQTTALLYPDLGFPMFSLAYWIIMSLLLWHMRYLKVLQFEIKRDKSGKEKK